MVATTAVSAFAAAPSVYDGKSYESVGYTSEDPDGEINLAVIANGKVDIVGDAMYIKGSVYSNDTIYVGNGAGNKVDGLFISGVKGMWDYKTPGDGATEDQYRYGYIHVDDDHQMTTNAYSTTLDYEGAILDTQTSFECSYTPYVIPEIANYVENGSGNEYWPGATVVSEDTHYGTFDIGGKGLIIDTTAGDVTVVIDKLNSTANNPYIAVRGTNHANIYINDYAMYGTSQPNVALALTTDGVDVWNWLGTQTDDNSAQAYFDLLNDPDQISLFINSSFNEVELNNSKIAANIYSNADKLTISGGGKYLGDVTSGAKDFTITGGATFVEGIVCVPNADAKVVNSGTLFGQLHTNTLTINGAGRIIWKEDKGATKVATPEPTVEPTPEPTVEPTPEPTPEVTLPPLPTGDELELTGGYAYIFGYEPDKIELVWVDDEEGGHTEWDIDVRMAPDDDVTREQVAAMIMRMIDQSYNTKSDEYPVTDNIAKHAGTWYERGLAYLATKGTFDGIDTVETGSVTRGEVAKLVVCGLNLSNTTETSFEDIADNPYKPYIEIMNAYGYMNGDSDTEFAPDRVMSRAEFCQMFNNIIGRNDMGLEAADGTIVTPETYYIVDLGDKQDWVVNAMLKATSAYDGHGYVDIDTRLANIRNTLDHYDSQHIA